MCNELGKIQTTLCEPEIPGTISKLLFSSQKPFTWAYLKKVFCVFEWIHFIGTDIPWEHPSWKLSLRPVSKSALSERLVHRKKLYLMTSGLEGYSLASFEKLIFKIITHTKKKTITQCVGICLSLFLFKVSPKHWVN